MSSTMRNDDAFSVFCSESRASGGQGRRDKMSKKEEESETEYDELHFLFK